MDILIMVLLGFGGLTAIGVAGVYALTMIERSRSKRRDSPELQARLDAMEQRLADAETRLDGIEGLEERLEFAERLLQRPHERAGLPPPDRGAT